MRATTCSTSRPVESTVDCIGGSFERRDRPGRIARVPLGDLARKGRKANIKTLVFQLLMASGAPVPRDWR